MELERARERLPLHEGAPGLGDPEEGGHRHLESRGHHVPPGPRGIDGSGGGGERGAEARPAIPHCQAVHLQLRDRNEPVQLAITGAQRGGVEATSIRPKGSSKVPPRGTTSEPSFEAKDAVSAQLKVCGDPKTGRTAPGTSISFGEEEGIGVDDAARSYSTFSASRPCRKDSSARAKSMSWSPRRDHRPVQLGNDVLGMLVEGVEETALVEHVARWHARLARRDSAPGEVE